jgi:hypothetical protein
MGHKTERKPRLLFQHVKDIINDLYPQLKEHMAFDQPLQGQSTKFKKMLGDLRHTDNDPLYLEYCKRYKPKDNKRKHVDLALDTLKKQRVEEPIVLDPMLEVAPKPHCRWPDVPIHLQPAYDVQELLLRLTTQFTASLDHSQELHEQLREQHALHLQQVAVLKRRIGQLEQGHLRLRASEASLIDELAACRTC